MKFSAYLADAKKSAVSAAVWTLVFLAALGCFYTLFGMIQDRRQSVVAALLQAAADTENGGVIERKANLANTTKDERDALTAAAIGQGHSADFIGQIETLGQSAGVTLEVSGVDQRAPKGNLAGSLSLSAKFTGSYAACMRFAALIETLPVITAVTPLTLTYDTQKHMWVGTLTLSALSFDTP